MTDQNGAMAPRQEERLQLHGEAFQQQSGEMSTTAAAAEANMTIQAAVIMARKFPRNEDQAFEALMRSCQRPRFAEVASYSFPRGGQQVSGASIKLAREAKRLWGNIRTGLEITFDEQGDGTTRDPGLRRIRGWAWDLQTNTYESFEDSFLKLHQRKVRGVDTQWIVPDERDLRELTFRRGAICVRNAILALMPPDLIDDARDEAAQTIEAQAKKDPEGEKKKLIMGFSRLKVTPEMLEELIGHPLAQASPAEIANLRQVFVSIRDGNTRWPDHVTNGDPTKNGMPKAPPDDPSPVAPPQSARTRKQAAAPSNEFPEVPPQHPLPPGGRKTEPEPPEDEPPEDYEPPPLIPSIDEVRDALKLAKVKAADVAVEMGHKVTDAKFGAKDFKEEYRQEAIETAKRIALAR